MKTNKIKLSVTLATRNEENNIARCLESVKNIADEIIIFDEHSSDNTVKIAKKYGAIVFSTKHHPVFHITKELANRKARGEWILQLDADEVITTDLANEILSILKNSHNEFIKKNIPSKVYEYKSRLFEKHQNNFFDKKGVYSQDDEVVAYYLPRKNIFLGKPLVHAGVYPDGVIRLFKNGKAYLPGKSVHEQMKVNGRVSWCYSDLEHHDSPTFERYLARADRYTDLTASDYKKIKLSLSVFTLINYAFIKPFLVFVNLYFRHAGFKDGIRGLVWSTFSAFHFPIAYFKYYSEARNAVSHHV